MPLIDLPYLGYDLSDLIESCQLQSPTTSSLHVVLTGLSRSLDGNPICLEIQNGANHSHSIIVFLHLDLGVSAALPGPHVDPPIYRDLRLFIPLRLHTVLFPR